MKPRIIVLTVASLLFAANVHAALEYLRAAEGVSYSHSHVQRTGGQLVEDPNSDTGQSWVNTQLTNIEENNRIPLEKGHGFSCSAIAFQASGRYQIHRGKYHPSAHDVTLWRDTGEQNGIYPNPNRDGISRGIVYLHTGRGLRISRGGLGNYFYPPG